MGENLENAVQKEVHVSRREFMKKSVYTAPSLLVLGSLAKSQDAKAAFGPPPSLLPGSSP